MAKQIKSSKKSASKLHGFRVILRGTKLKGKKALRVRHVFTTQARSMDAAQSAAQAAVNKTIKAESLKKPTVKVYAPLKAA
jgi:hypothetical protein